MTIKRWVKGCLIVALVAVVGWVNYSSDRRNVEHRRLPAKAFCSDERKLRGVKKDEKALRKQWVYPGAQKWLAKKAVRSMGGRSAPVVVETYYPFSRGHEQVATMVRHVVSAHEGRVRAVLIDFTAEKGFRLWRKAGLECGTVFVKLGKHAAGPAQATLATFSGPPGEDWTEQDLDRAVGRAVDRARPSPGGRLRGIPRAPSGSP